MEADGVKLSDDEVRERFSAYHDGELPAAEAAAVRAKLDADKALAAEYEAFRTMLTGLAGLASDVPADARPGVAAPLEPVDLLAGVQRKLHKRSGGRYFTSRFARQAGVVPLEAIAAAILLLLVLLYLSMTFISNVRPAEPPAAAPPARSGAGTRAR